MKGNRASGILFLLLLIGAAIPMIMPQDTVIGMEIGYHDSGDIADILLEISDDHPTLTEYHTAGDLLGVRDIPGSREIPILFVGDRSEDRPWVMLIGAHHGNEPDSAEAVLFFADDLLGSYDAGDERASYIVENLNIAILPVVNPYGLDMGTREDENGEDPNRDYPFEPAGVTSNTDGVPLTTAGAQAVHNLAGMYPFSIALSFHSGSKGIYHPWGAPNVGTFSPDSICFHQIGRELSNASGQGLEHGPANQFPYVADLSGAFDDHLYGSTFMPDHLYSPDMQLPWSTFTATVELDTLKNQHPGNLGSMEGLWEYPITDQGTIPLGVRICYAGCEMAVPGMEVDHRYDEGELSITGNLRGAVSHEDMLISVDGIPISPELQWEDSPLLPEMTFTTTLEIEAQEGNHHICISTVVDEDWTSLDDQADPEISPQSVIAGSREGLTLSWTGSFIVESEPPVIVEVEPPVIEIVHDEPIPLGNRVLQRLKLDISLYDNIPNSMTIIFDGDGDVRSIVIPGDMIKNGTGYFPIPELDNAGRYDVIVNLTYDGGWITDRGTVNVLPGVKVLHTEDPVEGSEIFYGRISATGVDGTIPVFWGVSRTQDEPWNGDGWEIGPSVIFPEVEPIISIPFDMTNLGREYYFRASPLIDGGTTEYDSFERFNSNGGVKIISSDPTYSDGEVDVGPVIILSNIDGLEDLNMDNTDMVVNVTIYPMEGDPIEMHLEWLRHYDMNENQNERLSRILYENGILMEDVRGAFFANATVPMESGNHSVIIRLSGNLTDRFSVVHPFNERSYSMLLVEEEDGTEDDDEREWMSWQLIAFLVIVALIILLVTYLRYGSHIKDPEPGEEWKDDDKDRSRGHSPREKGSSARKIIRR